MADEFEYLWEHWKFNADQRLKAFNFFVVFAIFANGGAITAIEKRLPFEVVSTIGAFVVVLAAVFAIVDARSQRLLQLSVPGLKRLEGAFPEDARLFALDSANARSPIRYRVAFRILFVFEFAFGLSLIAYSHWTGQG